jgi:hypothetical protein
MSETPPRVIADRWAITTSLPLPFDRDAIERGFRSARPAIAECLRYRKLPMNMIARIRLVWASDGTLATHVLHDDRELGPCAAAALAVATWPALRDITLDVTVTMRAWDETD